MSLELHFMIENKNSTRNGDNLTNENIETSGK